MATASNGYSRLSIIAHWVAAVAVIALFFTHEGPRDGLAMSFHVVGGALLGLFLIWRVVRRIPKGFPTKPDQHPLLNMASSIVLWGLLAAIMIVTLTGYLLPWSMGNAIDFGGLFSIPSPLPASRGFHEVMEEIHDAAGHIIVPLVVLHVLGAIKHAVINKDGVMQRMIKGTQGGV